jgi:hypothetical protein
MWSSFLVFHGAPFGTDYHDMLTGARIIDLSPFACVARAAALSQDRAMVS